MGISDGKGPSLSSPKSEDGGSNRLGLPDSRIIGSSTPPIPTNMTNPFETKNPLSNDPFGLDKRASGLKAGDLDEQQRRERATAALFQAARTGNSQAARTAIVMGADVNAKDENGKTVYDVAADNTMDAAGMTASAIAAAGGHSTVKGTMERVQRAVDEQKKK